MCICSWCCDTLDENEDGTERIPDEECLGGNLNNAGSGIQANGHCNGFPAGVFTMTEEQTTYPLGGACRAAIYRQPFTAISTCHDGVQNGDESGVDCGGSCPTCGVSTTLMKCDPCMHNMSNKVIEFAGLLRLLP